MVLAYHLILTAYGFWLPNDPRGSWSDFVRAWELRRFGPATKVSTHRSVAHVPHDRALRLAAKNVLAHDPVHFTGHQALAIARGFAAYCQRSGCVVHACAILPEHAHLVIARHHCQVEQVSNLLKGAATKALTDAGLHPFAERPYRNGKLPTPWARKGWNVFLDSHQDVRRAIAYVQKNPVREGKRPQGWWFVTEYAG